MANWEIEYEEEYKTGTLSPLGGVADYDGTELGLAEWTYQFCVIVTNGDGETRLFTVAYQPEERTNGMMNYSGYDVTTASKYGYDADQAHVLESFCDDSDVILAELYRRAKAAAKAEYEYLISCQNK